MDTPNLLNMKRLLLTIIFTLFSGLKVFATAQFPDKINYNGKEYNLNSNPLEVYFEKNPNKRPKSEVRSSALWRGYVATFEIIDNQLFLKDIEIQYRDTTSKGSNNSNWKSVLNEVFDDQKNIQVDWYTGLLVLPQGKVVNYVHMGYGSTYQHYTILELNKGVLTQEKQFKSKAYEKFKEKQFQVFKQTEDYNKMKSDLLQKGNSEEFIDSFLRSYVTQYTSKILTD
ncbi:MAG: hypothetical protein RLZZ321_1411 [Bacteroidota bacterium]|jgi:hypothetical protein